MSDRLSADRRSTYRLFVSHSWEYSDSYNRMVELLNDANRFDWDNYSVPEHDPAHAGNDAALRRELRNQIDPASVVIILAGMYVSHSKWIGEEIEIAENKEKPILGVRPRGNVSTPSDVSESADEIVNWNTDSIVEEVRNLSP